MLARWERCLELIAASFAAIGGIAVFALMAITDVAVIARYIVNNPIFGIEDVSVLLLAITVAASVAYSAWTRSHVSVELIELIAGPRMTRICGLLARLLGAGTVSYIAYALATIGSCGFPCGAVTGSLSIPHMPFYYFLAASMAFYFLVLLYRIAFELVHWRDSRAHDLTAQ